MDSLKQNNNASRNILRNILPALAVMIAGLIGAYLVYDNYLADRGQAAAMANLDPASGQVADATPGVAATTPATTATTAAAVKAKGVYTDEGEDSAGTAAQVNTSAGGDANPATMAPPPAPASSPVPTTAP